MRNPLKRQPGAAPRKPLRERLDEAKARLAQTKARARTALACAEVVMQTAHEPAPAPPVERIALINYATWLYHERSVVCRELYPESGADAHRFVHADTAADRFHFPKIMGQKPAAASTRAVDTLDRLGIDWRADRADSLWSDEPNRDNAQPAPVPHGWPQVDAALLEALDDLTRLDAAQDAMHDGTLGKARDVYDVPG